MGIASFYPRMRSFYTSQYRIDTSDDEYGCDGECYLSCHSGCSYVNITGGQGAAMPIRPVIGNEDENEVNHILFIRLL